MEYQNIAARTEAMATAHCRNLHISKFHPLRWKALWDGKRGWHVELRHK